MFDAKDLRPTIVPKSDQLNSEQLLAGPMTITVAAVEVSTSAEQPVAIHYSGDDGRPYKPCKTMRKVLILAWGHDGSTWAGKSMILFNDPAVKFGGQSVGGVRISHVSHINRDIAVALTATKGKKTLHTIKVLAVAEGVEKNAKKYKDMVASGKAKEAAEELADMQDAEREEIWRHLDDDSAVRITIAWPKSA